MFRSDWDVVSPLSWLGGLADEEAFFGGRELGFPTTTTFLLLPETHRRRREQTGTTREGPRETAEPRAKPQEQVKPDEAMDEELERERLLQADFFEDLPLAARQFETKVPDGTQAPAAKTEGGYSYYTYAYSCCVTRDDDGRPVESTRRRYEDSAGCLKAVHRRQLGPRSMESSWVKRSKQDSGMHDAHVSSGDIEGFEQAWKQTPFGAAEQQALKTGKGEQTELPDAPPAQEIP